MRLDPVRLMPDAHKVVFENAYVRIVDSRMPAGASEVRHWHPDNVTVALGEWSAEVVSDPGQKTTRVHRTFGSSAWNAAGIHEVRMDAGAPSHQIRIELKY